MPSITIPDFDLALSLESGQCFRYQKRGDLFAVVERDKICVLRQEGSALYFEGWPEYQVRRFFGLDEDYAGVIRRLSADDVLRPAVVSNHGLRLLRQDPWECLVGFVLSSASNIPRIKKSVAMLADGSRLARDGFVFGTLPRPGKLNIPEKGLGFRARYLSAINMAVTERWLDSLYHLSYSEAKQQLVSLPGVGEKIADCVLLFSYGRMEAFPVDVWIQRVMQELYCPELASPKLIAEEGRRRFGSDAGYAQQFLFHWRRTQGG